ncbi:TPA: hypothetical protein HA251_00480 [Candidatus Woesearchaeota archaeon]|nr:hypothetical protein [Candidatus Woesearchaeota archaeon]
MEDVSDREGSALTGPDGRTMSHQAAGRRSRPRNVARAIALSVIALFFLTVTLLSVVADGASITVTAPSAVSEGNSVVVSATGPGTITIALNNVIVATGLGSVSHSRTTSVSDAGLYQYLITSDAPGVASQSRTVEVLDVPLVVTPVSPSTSDISSSDVTIRAVANWPVEFCYALIDGEGHTLSADDGTSTVHSGVFTLQDGVHTIDYKCKLGAEIASTQKTVRVDTVAPTVLSTAPSADTNGPHITLAVDTSEVAQCRYGPDDAPYDSLPNTMGTTYAMRNTALIVVENEGPVTYFVRCRDLYGNTMQTSSILSFINRIPPSADISIDGETPLRAGTYRVSLKTAVPLANAPSLSYTLSDATKSTAIVLEGEDDEWYGYLVIPDGASDTVLSFSFSGKSVRGVTGAGISDGAVFSVDAVPPEQVSAVSVTNAAGGILLRWSAPDDDVASYQIYRRSMEGVSVGDMYAVVGGTAFTDASARTERYVYYRVAAVDDAGNVGPLSPEVYGSMVDPALVQEAVAIDPVLGALIDQELSLIESAMLDADRTIKSLEENTNDAELRIINDLDLLDRAREARLSMGRSADRLRSLRDASPSKDDVDAAVRDAQDEIATARTMLIRKILPVQSVDLKQPFDEVALRNGLPYVVANAGMDASAKASLLEDSLVLNEKLTVDVLSSAFRLYDAAGNDYAYTFVRKRIRLDSPVNDVVVLELVPREFISSEADITVIGDPVVLEDGLVLQFSYQVAQEKEFAYYVREQVPMEVVKTSRTLLYPKPQPGVVSVPGGDSETDVLATGFATRLGIPHLPSSSSDMLLVVLGITIIIALGAYYVSLSSAPFKGVPGVSRRTRGVPSHLGSSLTNGLSILSRKYRPSNDSTIAGTSGRARPAMPSTTSNGASVSTPLTAEYPSKRSSGYPSGYSPGYSAGVAITNSGASIRVAASTVASVDGPVGSSISAILSPDSSSCLAIPISSSDVRELLSTAERMIDHKNYELSLSAYKKVLHALSADEGLSQELHEHILRVYDKLLLFKRMDDARAAVDANDALALRAALDETRFCAERVGDARTTLITDAKDAYAGFVRELNRMEIAKNERY